MEPRSLIQSLTISIPAYNDSLSLSKLVNECQAVCNQLNIPVQILIINDGSHDNTLKVISEFSLKYSNITAINHEKNLGFGETLKQVFMLPKTEWVLFLPGDNQFPAINLVKLVELTQGYDFIIGYRKLRKDNTRRKLSSVLYNLVISYLSGYNIRDVNSIVLFRTEIFNQISLKGTSAFVHAEFFMRAVKAGFRIRETEILHQKREFGFGSGGNIKVINATIKELFLYFAGKL